MFDQTKQVRRLRPADGRIPQSRTDGTPLSRADLAHYRPLFDFDFAKVRVHTGPAAAEMASRLGVRALAVGSDVLFGAGQLVPGRAETDALLAHELGHVVQGTRPPTSAHRPG